MDIEVKGLLLFTNITDTLVYCTPAAKRHAFLKELRKEAPDLDIPIPEWSRWLILDGVAQIAVSHSGAFGAEYKYYNSRDGSHFSCGLSVAEAKKVAAGLDEMITTLSKELTEIKTAGHIKKTGFKKLPDMILTPASITVSYKVHRYGWKIPADIEIGKPMIFMPKFSPLE